MGFHMALMIGRLIGKGLAAQPDALVIGLLIAGLHHGFPSPFAGADTPVRSNGGVYSRVAELFSWK